MFQPKVAPACQDQWVVPVDVSFTVAGTKQNHRVIEQAVAAFRRFLQATNEVGELRCQERIVLPVRLP